MRMFFTVIGIVGLVAVFILALLKIGGDAIFPDVTSEAAVIRYEIKVPDANATIYVMGRFQGGRNDYPDVYFTTYRKTSDEKYFKEKDYAIVGETEHFYKVKNDTIYIYTYAAQTVLPTYRNHSPVKIQFVKFDEILEWYELEKNADSLGLTKMVFEYKRPPR